MTNHYVHPTSTVSDESWAAVAREARNVLKLLGWPIGPQCFPGEQDPCGGTFAQHAAANFGVLIALCEHQLEHLGPQYQGMAYEVGQNAKSELKHCELRRPRDQPDLM